MIRGWIRLRSADLYKITRTEPWLLFIEASRARLCAKYFDMAGLVQSSRQVNHTQARGPTAGKAQLLVVTFTCALGVKLVFRGQRRSVSSSCSYVDFPMALSEPSFSLRF